MRQAHISHNDVIHYTHEIIRQIILDEFKPQAVVTLVKGGLVVGNYLSQYFDVPLIALNKNYDVYELPDHNEILVADDINDTGATFNKLELDFVKVGLTLQKRKYAALIDNQASSFSIDYYGKLINKEDDNAWIVFPWEEWWKIKNL